MTVIPQRRSAH